MDMLIKANKIGYPSYKPRYGNQGKGVFANLGEELIHAYKILSKNKRYNYRKHIEGKDYRICLVDYKVVAASERIPPYIIGDGKSTIKDLVQELNKDPRRGTENL